MADVVASSSEKDIKIQKLEETLTTRTAELEKYKSLLDKAVPKLKEIKAELDVKATALGEKSDECEALKAKLAELSSSHGNSASDELAAKLATAEQKLVDTQEQFKGKMNKAVEKLKEMKSEVDQKTVRIVELESLLAEKSSSSASADDDHLMKENAKFLATIESLDSALAQYKQVSESKQNEFKIQISDLENQLLGSKELEKKLSHSLEELQAQRESLEAQNKVHLDKIESLNRELERSLADHAADCEQKIAETKSSYQAKLTKAIEKLKDMKAEADEKDSNIASSNALLAALREELEQRNREYQSLLDEQSSLKSMIGDLESKLSSQADADNAKETTKTLLIDKIADLEAQLAAVSSSEAKALEHMKELESTKYNLTESLAKANESILSHQVESNDLHAQISTLISKVDELNQQLDISQRQARDLEAVSAQVTVLITKTDELETQLEHKDAELKTLQALLKEEVDRKALLTQSSESAVKDLRKECQDLQTAIADLTIERNQYQQQVVDGEQKMIEVASQLSESLASAENEKLELSSNLSALKHKLDEAEAAVRDLANGKDAMVASALLEKDNELMSLQSQLSENQSRIKSLENQLQEQASSSQTSIHELDETNRCIQSQLDQCLIENDSLKNRIDDLESVLEATQGEVARLTSQIQDKDSLIDSQKNAISAKELNYQSYESERQQLESQMNDLNASLVNKDHELTELQGRYSETSQQLIDLQHMHEADASRFDGQIKHLESMNKGLNDSLSELLKTSSELSSQLEEKGREVESLHAELAAARSKLAEVEERTRGVDASSQELLQTEREEHAKKLAHLEDKFQQEIAAKEIAMKALEELSAQLKTQMLDLEAESSSLKTRIADAENQLTSSQHHASRLAAQVEASSLAMMQLEAAEKDLQKSSEELKSECQHHQQQAQQHEAMISELQRSLEEKGREVEGLHAELAAARNKLAEVEDRTRGVDASSQELLQAEREEHAKKLAHLEDKFQQEIAAKEITMKALEESSAQLKTQVHDLEAESSSLKTRIADAENQLTTSQDHAIILTMQVEANSVAITQLEEIENHLRKSNEELKSECQHHQQQAQQHDAMISELQRSLEEKGREVEGLHAELAAARSKLAEVEDRTRGADASSQELLQTEREQHAKRLVHLEDKFQQEIAAKESIIRELEELSAQLKTQVHDLEAESSSLKTRIADAESLLAASRDHANRVASQVEANSLTMMQLEAAEKDLHKSNDELKSECQHHQQQAQQHEAMISELQRSLAEKSANIDALQLQLSSQHNSSSDHADIIEALQQQLSLQHRQEKELQDLIGSLHAEVEIVNQEKDEQTSRLKADREMIVTRANQHITELEEELQETRYQMQSLNEQYIALQEHLREYESSDHMQASVDSSSMQIISSMESEKVEMLARMEELEQQNKTLSDIIAQKESLIDQYKDELAATKKIDHSEDSSSNPAANTAMDTATATITALEAKILEVQEEAKSKLTRAVDRIKELKAELENKSNLVIELEKERDAVKTQIAEAQEQFKQQTSKVLTRMKELKKEVDEKTKRISELESLTTMTGDTNINSSSATTTEATAERVEEDDREKATYQQRIQEFEADIVSLMERLSAANESERQLAEKHRDLESKHSILQQNLEERDAQIASYEDHVKSLTSTLQSFSGDQDELNKLKKTNENLKRRVDRFRQATECRLHPMQHELQVEVLMRVQDPIDQDTIWCLVNRERSKAELSIDRLFAMNQSSKRESDYIAIDDNVSSTPSNQVTEYCWYREVDLDFSQLKAAQSSHDASNTDQSASFSIEGGDDHGFVIPLTLQEQFQAQFESTYANERQDLVNQLASLREELENSQKAFDVYRERAKVSLLKTANEQQVLEAKYQTLQEQLKEERSKNQALETQYQAKEQTYESSQQQYEEKIQHEQLITQTLRQTLLEANEEVTRYKLECEKLHAAQIKLNLEEHEAMVLRVNQLEEEIKQLKSKEQQLMNDMKRRGDVARQMMMDKDKEIFSLKQKLQGFDVPSSVPVPSTSTPTKDEIPHAAAVEAKAEVVELPVMATPSTQSNGDIEVHGEHQRRQNQNVEATLRSKIKAMQAEIEMLRGRAALSSDSTSAGMVTGSAGQGEREKRFVYLKQAILGFFKAKQSVEMEHLGRVICAILGLTVEEQAMVMEGIASLAPIRTASTTLESFASNITSLFA